MKILVVTQSSEIVGGANRSLLSVIEILRNTYEHEIWCIVPSQGIFSEKLALMEIPSVVIPYLQTAFFKKGDIFDIYRTVKVAIKCIHNRMLIKELLSVLPRDVKFDCVYINDTTNTFGYHIARKLEIPFVWHFRSYDSRIRKYMISERVFRNAPNGKYIAISNAMKEYMIKVRNLSENDIEMVLNGVQDKSRDEKIPWSKKLTETIHCVECGAISEAKGQIDAIQAIIELKNQGMSELIYMKLMGKCILGK